MIDLSAFRPEKMGEIEAYPTKAGNEGDYPYAEPLAVVNDHLNRLGARFFIDGAQATAAENGQRFKYVGDVDSSRESAIVMPSPFGNGIWPHLVARAEALRHLAVEAGIRDDRGNTLPVVMVAAPSLKSTYGLVGREQDDVAMGDFTPIAKRHLRVLGTMGFESIRSYVGYSQPAVFGAPLARLAQANFDIANVQLQETPNSRKRTILSLGVGMMAIEGMRFKKGMASGKIDVIDELFATHNAADQMEKGVLQEKADYWSMVKGFAKGRLEDDLNSLCVDGVDTFVLWAAGSAVTSAKHTKATVSKVADSNPSYSVRSLEIVGANHSYGDMVGHFAATTVANL
jgi:hypothetical protein